MYEQLGLGVDFQFKHSGQSDLNSAIADMNKLYNTSGMTTEGLDELNKSFNTFVSGVKYGGLQAMLEGIAITMGNIGMIMKASKYEDTFTGALKYMSDTSAEGIANFNMALSDSAKWLGITKDALLGATKEYMAMGLAQEKAIEMAESVAYAGQVWDVLPQEAAVAFKGIAAAYNLDFLVKDTRDVFIDMVNQVADYTALTGSDTLNFLSAAGSGLKLIGNTGMEGAMGIAAAARRAEVDITHLGYGMRTISKRYASASGEEQFAKLGIAIRDAQGNLKPFDQALAEVAERMSSIDANTMTTFATKLGGLYSDDLLRTLNGWQEYDKTMGIISTRDYAGSAEAEWNKINKTFSHQTNVTKVIWDDFVQSTFGQLLGVLSPIVGAFNKVFDAVTKFLTAHPILGKLVAGFSVLAGIALVVGGAMLFVIAQLTSLSVSFITAGGATKVFGGALVGLRTMFGGFKPVIFGFAKQMASLALTFGALYFVWKYDIFGIRALLEGFTNDVKTAFATSKELALKGSIEIQNSLANMDVSNNFIDRLTAFFTRVQIAWDALKDLWSDYTISDEMYDKLVASGMEPTVTRFMMLVYRMRNLWEGFKEGFGIGCEIVRNFVTNVLGPPFIWLKDNILEPVGIAILDFLTYMGLIDENSSLLKGTGNEWMDLGKKIGVAVSAIVTFLATSRIISTIGAIIRPIIGIFQGIGGIIANVIPLFGSLWGWISSTVIAIGGVVTAILGAMGIVITLPAWFVGVVTVAIAAVLALIWNFRDEIWAVFGKIGTAITIFFTETVPEAFLFLLYKAEELGGKLNTFATVTIPSYFKGLYDEFKEIAGNAIQGFINGIEAKINSVKTAISNFGSNVVTGLKDILGIHSPSTVFADMGMNSALGYVKGISGMKGLIDTTLTDMMPSDVSLSAKANLGGYSNGNMMPSNSNLTDYSSKVSSIYNNRYDTSNVQTNNGITLKIDANAFNIQLSGISKKEDVPSIGAQLKEYVETAILDAVRNLKDEQYEM